MSQRRDLFILLLLFLALVIFTILGPGRSGDNDRLASKPTTHSSSAGGALALLRWLQELGYDAQRLEYTDFALTRQTSALVMLSPTEQVNRTHTGVILDWVEEGGILLLTEDNPWLGRGSNHLLQELHLAIEGYERSPGKIERAPVVQPVLNSPPLTTVLVQTTYVLAIERDDVAHLVGLPTPASPEPEPEGGEPAAPPAGAVTSEPDRVSQAVLVGIKHGKGYIYVSSASFPFTNEGLRDSENAALVLNLLRRVPEGGRILFDEWHHGFFTPPSLRSIMVRNPWGQAVIYLVVVLALYFLLTGRRFGRPIPLHEEVAQRSSAEYVESMADLFQRGQKRDFVLQRYYVAFKRQMAKPYGINPHLDDAAFADELARLRARGNDQATEREHLLALLSRLRRQRVSEGELLETVIESDRVLRG
ncbi:MAG: DUF4350 domain-containing protein [Chloroflexaceae bacterium]|nr:DUF4350 domain-containing protein [Chloroflexaceae bacterium]